MTNFTKITLSAVTIALLSGCGDTTITQEPSNVTIIGDTTTTTGDTPSQETGCAAPTKTKFLSGLYDVDTDLTADTLWLLDGLVVMTDGTTLTIDPCTTIAGMNGTGDNTSYIIIDKNAQIIADGTAEEPIVFTSADVALNGEAPAVGQWGGITIIGNAGNEQVKAYEVNTLFAAGGGKDKVGAIVPGQDLEDSSGVLRHVKIFNSGIKMRDEQEINGLSFVGVGSGTVVEDITVDNSDDDGIELWGGTVNLTNITITRCTDDYFDIDDGFSGRVENLNITQDELGNAAIEMSGITAATFDGFTITQNGSAKEGGIYFKQDGVGGHFLNGTVTDNNEAGVLAGAIHSYLDANENNISFTNVTLEGTSTEARFTDGLDKAGLPDGSAADIRAIFIAGTGNTVN